MKCDRCGREVGAWVCARGERLCGYCAECLGLAGSKPQARASVVEEFLAKEAPLRLAKRRDYASDEDPLANFKVVGSMSGLKPEQVAYVYTLKHIQAIGKAVMEGSWRESWSWETTGGREGLKQRIADARAYLLLLAEVLDE